ncbi:MAG: tyrosine-type recombinase/integrase [Clostridiales bacterium]|nr:tyrosine-type recombinase/integrase [Clostridiales bacterium]
MRLPRLCNKPGIYRKSPHKIRKTYGSILLDSHVDNRMITDQMGHTDIGCTENYYHRNRKSIEQKTHILSDIPEFKAI